MAEMYAYTPGADEATSAGMPVPPQMPQYQQKGRKGGKVKVVLLTVFLVLSLIGNGFLCFLLFLGPGYTFSFETGLIGGANVVLDGTIDLQTPDQIAAREQNKDEPYRVSYIITKNPVFLTGDSAGKLALENPPESRYDLVLSIYLTNGLHVYNSPKLKPVQYMTSAKLLKDLDAGEYKGVGYLSFYDPETGEYVGRQGTDIVITIQN